MILKLRSSLFLTVFFTAVSIPQQILCSTSPTQHSPTLHKPSNKPPIVYTAEKSREESYPSYKQPTIATNLGQLYDEIQTEESNNNKNEPENAGFVEPLDFNSFLSDVGYKGKKANNLPLFTSESNTKDTFAGFFGANNNNKGRDSFVEPNFGGISSAASDQKSRKHGAGDEGDDAGFVDPNVQFRSLFESSETADGFRPQDFLGSKSNNVGADPSKSQTRAVPSYTYTGRQDNADDADYDSQPNNNNNNKYRSSYRQVNSRERPSTYDPYDDRNYYAGENDDSPAPPANPKYQNSDNNNRYQHRNGEEARNDDDDDSNNNSDNNKYSPAVQESSHKPQASSSGPKAAESSTAVGKGKCKKVQKQVDYSDDYGDYVDPDPDYDPSSYSQNQRYKRQAAGGGRGQQRSKNKQPMTCYVCQDEQGRYAERCSFDSKADPKQGSYFTSSSTSFTDKGRPGSGSSRSGGRGNGGGASERYRRNPSLSSKITPTSTTAASTAHISKTSHSNSERDKRQSPGNGGRNNNNNNNRNNNNNNNEYDYNDNNSNERGGNDDSYDDYNGEDYGAGSQRRNEYDTPTNTPRNRGNGNDDERNYGFGPPQGGNRNGNGQNGNEFDFGPPADFGSTTAGSNNNNNNQGFGFDFSIPRDFESDANLGTSNTNNRPVFSGSNNNNNNNGFGGGPSYDTGYEDYVKKYFPEAFDDDRRGGGGGSTPGPAPSSSSYRPHGHLNSSPSPSHGHSPNKEHTQQSHHYAPAPYYGHGNGQGHGSGHGHGQEHGTHLDKLMGAFNHRDRSGCEKVNKGDMTCFICRDAKGMNKEECMYASGDPNGKNTRMAYHESTEYSSPSASVLPLPKPVTSAFTPQTHTLQASSQSPPVVVHTKVTKEESKIIESKKKSPVDYDFDY